MSKRCKEQTQSGKVCKKSKCSGDYCSIHCSSNECGICLGTINNIFYLNCGHKFCTDCICNWSYKNDTCPMCRRSFSRYEKSHGRSWAYKKNLIYPCFFIYLDTALLRFDEYITFYPVELNCTYEWEDLLDIAKTNEIKYIFSKLIHFSKRRVQFVENKNPESTYKYKQLFVFV